MSQAEIQNIVKDSIQYECIVMNSVYRYPFYVFIDFFETIPQKILSNDQSCTYMYHEVHTYF